MVKILGAVSGFPLQSFLLPEIIALKEQAYRQQKGFSLHTGEANWRSNSG